MSIEQEFADQKFRIECSQIVLTKAGGTPLVVRGPGEIWQDDEGVLQYKVFADRAGYRGLQAYMSRPGVIGQIIPDEDYFVLEAQDYALPCWTEQRVLPAPRGGVFDGLAHGYLQELMHTEGNRPNSPNGFVTLRFRGKLEFPSNQGSETVFRVGGQDRHTSIAFNRAIIEDGDLRFEVFHQSEHTVVSLQLPAGQLYPATPYRIHEALQFILGQQLTLMVVEMIVGTKKVTRLTSASRGNGKMSPPLQFEQRDEGGHIWRMFTNYFRHVHSKKDPDWHPKSRHVGSATESTAASLEATVLALAVAVEGLAGDSFPSLAPVDPDLLRHLDNVQSAVQWMPLSQQNRDRISGTLNAMRKPRNSDILRAFITTNRLPKDLYAAWSRLRNASAHGGGAGGREIEEILRLRYQVLSLLYSLVFTAINYGGARTDYSLPGWPNGAWPIPQPPAAAPAAPPTATPAAPASA